MPRFIIFQFPHFNSLPHAEVDAARVADNMIGLAFQLTTSRRGRPEASNAAATLEIFQLTTSRRGRPECGIRIFYQYSYFNSLPHAEVDCIFAIIKITIFYFNSLPHAEVDFAFPFFRHCFVISTHYLTQR